MNFLVIYLGLVGSAAILVLCGLATFHADTKVKRFGELMALASGAVFLAPLLIGAALYAASQARPMKLDFYVYAWEHALFGGDPSFALGRLFGAFPLLNLTAALAYNGLMLVVLLVFGLYLWKRSESEAFFAAKVFFANATLSIPLFLLFPVCGPRHVFPEFPSDPGSIPVRLVASFDPPNGVPSVHLSTALLIAFFLWRWPAGRVFGTVFVALTALATLGSGEHYVFDLIAAIPYAFGVFRVASAVRRRTASVKEPDYALSNAGS